MEGYVRDNESAVRRWQKQKVSRAALDFINANEAEARNILVKRLKLAEQAGREMFLLSYRAELEKKSLDTITEAMYRLGLVKSKIDLKARIYSLR